MANWSPFQQKAEKLSQLDASNNKTEEGEDEKAFEMITKATKKGLTAAAPSPKQLAAATHHLVGLRQFPARPEYFQ